MKQKGRECGKLYDVGIRDLYFLRIILFAVRLVGDENIHNFGVGLKTQNVLSDMSTSKTEKEIV
jgi:hypothetical protein